jgi:hypothetical protein
LVIKLTEVLRALLGSTPVWPCGLKGRYHCSRCSAYRVTKPTTLKNSIAMA